MAIWIIIFLRCWYYDHAGQDIAFYRKCYADCKVFSLKIDIKKQPALQE